jgi:hypothetical protein
MRSSPVLSKVFTCLRQPVVVAFILYFVLLEEDLYDSRRKNQWNASRPM